MNSARSQAVTVARYTLLEALRTRLPWLVLATLLLALLGSLFVREIAITETLRMQTSFLAAGLRLAAVFILVLYITSSMVREFNDKGLELLLSMNLPRAAYAGGKFFGFSLIALLMTVLICLPLVWLVPVPAVGLWGLSLMLELLIVVSLSLFCIVTFTHVLPAASFVMAFYLLARSITAIRLISGSVLFNPLSPSHRITTFIVDALSLVMPAFDAFTQTAWLVNQNGAWRMVPSLIFQCMFYTGILLGATLFDLYRKSL
jgi:hypothetical protein